LVVMISTRNAQWGLAAGLAFLVLSGYCRAENNGQLQRIQSDISSVTENMERINQQRDDMQNLLAEVDQRYGETAAALRTLQQQIDEKRTSLEKIPLEIQKLEKEIAQCNEELAEQVRAAYVVGQKARLKLMLSQQDPAISSRVMVYYDYFNKSRLAKLAFVEASVKRLDLLSQQKQKDAELLEKNLAQKKVEQENLEGSRKERNALLLQLNKDFSTNKQRLVSLKQREDSLVDLVDSLDIEANNLVFEGDQDDDSGSTEPVDKDDNTALPVVDSDESAEVVEPAKVSGDFSTLKGKLSLPVVGRIASTFGNKRLQGVSNGILITADEGTDIRAVSKGRVAYAGNLQGYGLLMIVEHGEEYMTLYAFNQSLYKKKGDRVDAGEVIAAVGQSGGRSQPGLYFEIRKKGKPIDPLAWCH
jgi:murein hydrolase activator